MFAYKIDKIASKYRWDLVPYRLEQHWDVDRLIAL